MRTGRVFAPGLWFQKDFLKKWVIFRRQQRFSLSQGLGIAAENRNFSKLQAFGFRRTFEKMGNFPAPTALFIKPGLMDWSENRNFSKLQAFGFRRTFDKMGSLAARKPVFVKAELKVWSPWAFSRRGGRFSLRQGLGFGAHGHFSQRGSRFSLRQGLGFGAHSMIYFF